MNDLILALYPRTSLAKDGKVPVDQASSAEFSIGQVVRSKAEVDAILRQAQKAGARITDPAPTLKPSQICAYS